MRRFSNPVGTHRAYAIALHRLTRYLQDLIAGDKLSLIMAILSIPTPSPSLQHTIPYGVFRHALIGD
jgi:hypothetical protein